MTLADTLLYMYVCEGEGEEGTTKTPIAILMLYTNLEGVTTINFFKLSSQDNTSGNYRKVLMALADEEL